jgi:hypothetical protein
MLLAECSMAMWLGHSCMGLTSKRVQHEIAVLQAEPSREEAWRKLKWQEERTTTA